MLDEGLLDFRAQATTERAALKSFSERGNECGGKDCIRVLHDWFPRLLDRIRRKNGADTTVSDYRDEIDNCIWILNDLRDAFAANVDRAHSEVFQKKIWSWPAEWDLRYSPKEWGNNDTPADTKRLEQSLSTYIERPWLQHNIIDGAAINAFLFSAVSHAMDLSRTGAFGRTDWGYMLRKMGVHWHPFWQEIISLALTLILTILSWSILPGIAASLLFLRYQIAAEITFGLWAVLTLYLLVTFPARRRRAKEGYRTIGAMRAAWEHSRGEVINPTRLRELVLDAEQRGAIDYPPVLHTLIDRAINRDPTAFLTRKMPTAS